jgi:DnaK suppressor protein
MQLGKKKDTSAAAAQLIHGIKPYVQKKNEDYMSKAMLEHFRNILNAWKQELLDEVSRTVHSMQDETANHPDPNDRASQETDMALELRSRDRERKLIKKIEEAIATIDSGEYGFCETCGVEIGVQRLEARPTATLCVDCKTLDEIREKQMG